MLKCWTVILILELACWHGTYDCPYNAARALVVVREADVFLCLTGDDICEAAGGL